MRSSRGHDEAEFYRKWGGRRTRMADLITWSEVGVLEELTDAWRVGYDYDGPILGTEHVYPMGGLNWAKDRQRRLAQRARREATD